MKFEKIINITITKEEQEILKQAENFLEEICRCFVKSETNMAPRSEVRDKYGKQIR
mgnify:CR=1 FL=1